MKAHLSIILLLAIESTVIAQDYDFKVMVNSGSNQVMKKGTSSWADLKTGTSLFSGDKISIAESGYVLLIHNSGDPIELRTAGVKEIDQIKVEEDKVLSGKYLSYVITKMAPDEQEQNRKKYAEITGATERGFNAIELFMNSSSPLYNSDVVIRWTDMGAGKKYKVTLENMFDEIVKEYVTDKNSLELNLDNETLSSYQLLSVKVNVAGDKNINSEKYSIQRIGKDEFGKYKSELEELTAVLDKDSPMSHLIMAEFYESHNLLLDASTCYEHALVISNGLDYFQQAYVQFLMRQGWSDVL